MQNKEFKELLKGKAQIPLASPKEKIPAPFRKEERTASFSAVFPAMALYMLNTHGVSSSPIMPLHLGTHPIFWNLPPGLTQCLHTCSISQ